MTAALVFARKEVHEILRTWRAIVLPAMLLLFAVTGPLLAKFTPDILTAVGGSQFAGLTLPDPTAFDAYGQWVKNLSQITLIAIIIMYGGIVSAERRSGTAVLVLTKPLSRVAFVVAKVVVHAIYLAALLTAGTLVTQGMTAVLFGTAPEDPLWAASGVWLILALVYLSLTTLFSVLIRSAAGASGAALGAFAVLSIASIWTPFADYSPAGLLGRAATLAADTDTDPLFWPIAVSLVVCVLAVGAAALLFRRQEL